MLVWILQQQQLESEESHAVNKIPKKGLIPTVCDPNSYSEHASTTLYIVNVCVGFYTYCMANVAKLFVSIHRDQSYVINLFLSTKSVLQNYRQ